MGRGGTLIRPLWGHLPPGEGFGPMWASAHTGEARKEGTGDLSPAIRNRNICGSGILHYAFCIVYAWMVLTKAGRSVALK